MIATSAPSTFPRTSSGPGPLRRAGLAAVMVLGPLSITILSAISTYSSTDDSATIATKVAEHQTAQTVSLWLAMIATVTLVPGVIALGSLAVRNSPRLATWGMALAVPGFSLLWVLAATDLTALAGARSGIGHDATTRVLDEMNGSPMLSIAVLTFVVGHVVGLILLGAGLLRGRVIPAWTAWALIVSQPLHVVFAVVVPSNALDAAAWALTTVGFTAAATAVVGSSPTQPALR